ncbi:unnamed protein product, partial [Heterosigma akashiwo]
LLLIELTHYILFVFFCLICLLFKSLSCLYKCSSFWYPLFGFQSCHASLKLCTHLLEGDHNISGGVLLLLPRSCTLLLFLIAGTALEVLKREGIQRIPPL